MRRLAMIAACTLVMASCSDDGGNGSNDPDASPQSDAPNVVDPPLSYTFDSRFIEGESSVSYTGQIARHLLITEMKSYIGGMTAEIDGGTFTPVAGQVVAALDFYYRFDSTTSGQTPLTMTTDPPLLQMVHDDIATGKNLFGKLAGNDPIGQHRDWNTEFAGWNPAQASNPEALLLHFFGILEQQTIDRVQGNVPVDPDGVAIAAVYVTPTGLDLQQLIQKFLLGAVTYSQGTDDYMDSDLEAHGINVSNLQDEDKAYSSLEHHWDEAFGFFGASRDYNDYTDEEAAAKGGRPEYASGYHDIDGDGAIDLNSEIVLGNAQNASKRDLGSAESAATDFSKNAMDAFIAGRHIINSAEGDLDQDQLDGLYAQRDIAVQNWEKAISATVVHYINDTLQDMNDFDTAEYSFVDHAKHWSELKGFALGLQFNPRSMVSSEDFAQFHNLIGDAPVLPNADPKDITAYRADLIAARNILAQSYGFDAANLGDDNGENGW